MTTPDSRASAARSAEHGRSLAVECPAKINLHLRVGPARDDGFHPLLSWMCTVGLFDRLELQVTPAREPAEMVRLACDAPGIPADERNLVHRAIRGWHEHLSASGRRPDGVIAAKLTKCVPHGAGLGGGSSDAAFALMAAERLWRPDGAPSASTDELAAVAARFGSDIPFFLFGPSSACRGRGERVRPIAPPQVARWAVLLLPGIHLPTPDVYRQFDGMGLGRSVDVEQEPDWADWARRSPGDLLEALVNDLEAPAFALRPELAEMRRSAERLLARPVRMSGSGSSLFTLFAEPYAAEEAAARVARTMAVRAEAVELASEARWNA
jgi:4-diphosphocytidyl-2-C-methyl-D-erythritol kinase